MNERIPYTNIEFVSTLPDGSPGRVTDKRIIIALFSRNRAGEWVKTPVTMQYHCLVGSWIVKQQPDIGEIFVPMLQKALDKLPGKKQRRSDPCRESADEMLNRLIGILVTNHRYRGRAAADVDRFLGSIPRPTLAAITEELQRRGFSRKERSTQRSLEEKLCQDEIERLERLTDKSPVSIENILGILDEIRFFKLFQLQNLVHKSEIIPI